MVSQDRVVQLRGQFVQLSEQPSAPTSIGSSSGGEPPWSPLERRVAKLEDDMSDVKDILRTLEPRIIEIHAAIQPMRDDIGMLNTQYGSLVKDVADSKAELSNEVDGVRKDLSKEIADIRPEVAEIKGLLRNIPGYWQTIVIVLAILGATFTALRFLQ